MKPLSAPGLSSLGVRNFESVVLGGVSGIGRPEMETLFVLITHRRSLGDNHPKHHTRCGEPRYD